MGFALASGLTCVGVFAALDTLVRLQLKDAGEDAVFFSGGTLDYSKYLRLRRQHGWSGWPVYLMPVFLLVGVGLVVWALFRP
jgi:hypothetical protein